MSPFLSDPLPPRPDPASEGAEARHPAAIRRSVRAFRSKGFAEQRDSCKKEEVPGSCCVRRSARAACPCCFFFGLPSFCALPGGDSALSAMQKMVRAFAFAFSCAQMKRLSLSAFESLEHNEIRIPKG